MNRGLRDSQYLIVNVTILCSYFLLQSASISLEVDLCFPCCDFIESVNTASRYPIGALFLQVRPATHAAGNGPVRIMWGLPWHVRAICVVANMADMGESAFRPRSRMAIPFLSVNPGDGLQAVAKTVFKGFLFEMLHEWFSINEVSLLCNSRYRHIDVEVIWLLMCDRQ